MQIAFLLSLLLHVMAILFMYFDGSLSFKKPVIDESTLIVDFTHIAEKTTAPLKSHQPAIQKKPEVKKAQPEKPAEQKEQKEQVQDNISPEKPKEKIKEPTKAPKPPQPIKEALKKPEKNKSKPKKPVPQKNKSQSAQRNLDAKDIKSQKGAKNAMDDILNDVKDEESLDDALDHIGADESAETFTVSEIAALKSHIAKCWNIHAGAKDARNHIVDIEIHLDPAGYVTQTSILDKARMQEDPFYRISAQAAQRSLLDTDCSPLPIPKSSSYEKWKVITFRFDPKEMF